MTSGQGRLRHPYKRRDAVGRYHLLRDIPESVHRTYAKTLLNYMEGTYSFIDIGCGKGELLRATQELLESEGRAETIKIVGIDSSRNMISAAQQNDWQQWAREIKDPTNPTPKCSVPKFKIQLYQSEFLKSRLFESEGFKNFDVTHCKAMLHCVAQPTKVLDKIAKIVPKGKYFATGHESSQIEDRIEQLFNYAQVDDPDAERIFEHYFLFRKELGIPYMQRMFPAGDTTAARQYLEQHGFSSVREEQISFSRTYTGRDILNAMTIGTFGVFHNGVNAVQKIKIGQELMNYALRNNMDLETERSVPAKLHVYVMKRV